jgi:hypothetical protein
MVVASLRALHFATLAEGEVDVAGAVEDDTAAEMQATPLGSWRKSAWTFSDASR